jgi:hypothetical protein
LRTGPEEINAMKIQIDRRLIEPRLCLPHDFAAAVSPTRGRREPGLPAVDDHDDGRFRVNVAADLDID